MRWSAHLFVTWEGTQWVESTALELYCVQSGRQVSIFLIALDTDRCRNQTYCWKNSRNVLADCIAMMQNPEIF